MGIQRITAAAKRAAKDTPEKKRRELVGRVWRGERPLEVAGSAGLDFRSLIGWQRVYEGQARHSILSGGATVGSVARSEGVKVETVKGWLRSGKRLSKAKRNPAKVVIGGKVVSKKALIEAVTRAILKVVEKGTP